MHTPNYVKSTAVAVPSEHARPYQVGREAIIEALPQAVQSGSAAALAVKCYPGVHDDEIRALVTPDPGGDAAPPRF